MKQGLKLKSTKCLIRSWTFDVRPGQRQLHFSRRNRRPDLPGSDQAAAGPAEQGDPAPGVKPEDTRILAATNQDLEQKITQNRFREDLFYRLNVATLTLPSLDTIREDIPLLVAHFLDRVAR